MMYNYPFFSFPHFKRYNSYYQYPYVNNVSVNALNHPNYNRWEFNKQNNMGREKSIPTQNHNLPKNFYRLNNTKKANEINTKYNNSKKDSKNDFKKDLKKDRVSFKKTPSGFSFLNNILNQEDRDDDEQYFDLFGLKLYNDDLLLIGLIFFLYKEEVKDQYLFFALILLLLS